MNVLMWLLIAAGVVAWCIESDRKERMASRSHSNGHPTEWRDGRWVWADTGKPLGVDRRCNECGRSTVNVGVFVPADLSCTGKRRWEFKPIDACIAPIVAALQAGGIDMLASCCGHGETGEILLEDGRILEVNRCPDES